MKTDLITVSPDTKVGEAIRLLFGRHFRSVPIVDEDMHLIGQFSVRDILSLAMPCVAGMGLSGPMSDITFMPDDFEDVRRRLSDNWGDPVSKYALDDYIVLRPNDPMTHVVQALYRCRAYMPVVDPDTEKLVGVVSYWDVLEKLVDGIE